MGSRFHSDLPGLLRDRQTEAGDWRGRPGGQGDAHAPAGSSPQTRSADAALTCPRLEGRGACGAGFSGKGASAHATGERPL